MGKHETVVAAATSPALAVPEAVIDFIGKPSLLKIEVAADYDALLLRLAETVNPKDAIEWIWVADVTNLVWEMRRFRGMRDAIVDRETAETLHNITLRILRADYNADEVDSIKKRLDSNWKSGNPWRRQIVRRFLRRRGVDISQIHSFKFGSSFDEFTKLDGLIANLGRRRDSVLREIERRRDAVARRLRDVTDAEFEITNPGTQPVGN